MWHRTLFLTAFILFLILSPDSTSSEYPPVQNLLENESKVLRVGTMHSPPFAIKSDDGTWSGISIDLWREVAAELKISYQFEEHTLADLLGDVANNELAVVVAALTVTEEREAKMDFTHPIHSTGFAIAIRASNNGNIWFTTFKQLFSWQFIKVVLYLFLLLFFVGTMIWLLERKHRQKNMDTRSIKHIGEGFWWAAATMTTVGYGDKTPLTKLGRAFGVIWMFTALIIVASFIAAFSSILTVQNISANIQGLKDLDKMRVATVPGSTSESFLHHNHIATLTFSSVRDGLNALSEGSVDAMVYDAPLLKYFVQTEFNDSVEISSVTFERQDYGFALPENSTLREPVNRILLRIIRGDRWSQKLKSYLGN